MPTCPGSEPDPEPLPTLYARWLREALGTVPSRELRADCGDCPMSSDTAGSHAAVRFDDRVKCCTYLPVLPNYLVGQCLADPTVPAAGVAIAASVDRRLFSAPTCFRSQVNAAFGITETQSVQHGFASTMVAVPAFDNGKRSPRCWAWPSARCPSGCVAHSISASTPSENSVRTATRRRWTCWARNSAEAGPSRQAVSGGPCWAANGTSIAKQPTWLERCRGVQYWKSGVQS